MVRSIKKLIEIFAALLAVLLLGFALLVWRLGAHPVEMTRVTPYLQQLTEVIAKNGKIQFAEAYMAWNQQGHEFTLIVDKPVFSDPDTGFGANAPRLELALSPFAILRGKILPRALRVDSLEITAKQESGAPEQGEGASRAVLASFVKALDELATKNQLHDIEITNTHFALNRPDGKTAQLKIPAISIRHDGKSYQAKADLAVIDDGKEAHFHVDSVFDRDKKKHDLTATIEKINPQMLAGFIPGLLGDTKLDLPVSGKIQAVFDSSLALSTVEAKIAIGAGQIVAPSLWEKPRPIRSIAIEAAYDRAKNKLSVPVFVADLGETKIDLRLDSSLLHQAPKEGPKDMGFTMQLSVADLPMDDFTNVWPIPAAPNVREWIMGGMTKGRFTKAKVTANGRFDWQDPLAMVVDTAGGVLSANGARVKYLDGMPPAENVGAEASFDLGQMDVQITGGVVSGVKLLPTLIQITDLDKYDQYIDIPVRLSGPVSDVLRIMDAPPLGYAKEVGLKPDESSGFIEGTLFLHFPLLKDLMMKDVSVRAEAALRDVQLLKLIDGIPIENGSFSLALDKSGYSLKGPAHLRHIPLQVSWQGNFASNEKAQFESQAIVTGSVDSPQIAHLDEDIAKQIKGPVPVSLRYTQPRSGVAQLTGEINLKSAQVDMPDYSWKKPAGTTATLLFSAELPKGKPIALRQIDLAGQGLKVKGTARLDPDTLRILSIDLKPALIGRTNATIHFDQNKTTRRTIVDGDTLDIAGIQSEKDPAKRDPRAQDITLRVGKMYASENGYLTGLYGRFLRDKDGWLEMDVHATTETQQPVDIKFAPSGGVRTLAISSPDFGSVLKGFGLTDTIKGGTMAIHGQSSAASPRLVEGTVSIGAFSVTGLPVLVRLVSAASPFGFADLITGETSFDRMKGSFKWHGDEIELQKIRLAGTSYGLNVNGSIDTVSGNAALSGTLVPFSFVNGLLGKIPLIGDVITGGEGQGVIAASYSVKGALADPSISVNPVSLLTPGFLRNLFFGNDEAEEKDGK